MKISFFFTALFFLCQLSWAEAKQTSTAKLISQCDKRHNQQACFALAERYRTGSYGVRRNLYKSTIYHSELCFKADKSDKTRYVKSCMYAAQGLRSFSSGACDTVKIYVKLCNEKHSEACKSAAEMYQTGWQTKEPCLQQDIELYGNGEPSFEKAKFYRHKADELELKK